MTASHPHAAIRTLVVDDEAHARDAIVAVLSHEAGVEVVGEAVDGVSAVRAIETLAPDLVFLDVQMPELDGFGVVEAIDPVDRPQVIFVTAYSEFAVDAFEVHAVDYVLKPFDHERLRMALARVRDRDRRPRSPEPYEELLRDVRNRPDRLHRFTVRERGRISFVDVRQVHWVSADGNYVRIRHRGRDHLIRIPLSAVEARTPPGTFIRIHRSTLVNVGSVAELTPRGTGDYTVRLADDSTFTLSRHYRDRFFALMGG